MWRNPRVLQISDLHFGKSVNPLSSRPGANDDAKQALQAAVLATRPDFLVVTGDLTNGGRPEEFVEVKSYLEGLLDQLWAAKQATRCIVIPGNHDVWRTTVASMHGYLGRQNRLEEFDGAFPERGFMSASVPAANLVHLTPKSLTDYYQSHGGKAGFAVSRAEAERMNREAQQFWEFFPSFQLAILKLDSNVKLSRWKPGHIARGLVGLAQRGTTERVKRDFDQATLGDAVPFSDARRIALVHHHVTRLPNVKLENWMLMDDAGEVARWLARMEIRVVLHGHYHRADLLGLTYWNTEAQNSKIETIVVSAGAATALSADDGHNSCHLVDLEHFRIHVRRPLLDNGEFQPIKVAQSFEFGQKLDLTLEEDETTTEFPLSTDVLETSLEGAERYADRVHTYTNVETDASIDKDRNYFADVLLEGMNESGLETTYVPFTFAAAGSQYFADCDCHATDLIGGKEITVELMERRPLGLFACRIYFADPLPPNGHFRINVRFKIPRVMLDENDYDMLNLMRFVRGVAKARFCLLSEKEMVGVALKEVRGGRLIPSQLPLRKVKKMVTRGDQQVDATGYEITMESPTALCYLILYHKLVER